MLATRVMPALAVLMLSALALPAQQQRVIVRHPAEARERAATEFEQEVERLTRELLSRRQVSLSLTRTMQSLQVALRNSNVQQLQRAQFEARLASVRDQLIQVEADGERLRRQLSELCPTETKPDGWVGIAYGGDIAYNREGSGPVVTRFLDVPIVQTVEPGSPAERAGLMAGDRILAIGGMDVRDRSIAISPLLKPGKKIPFRVKRGLEVKTLTVTVERRPDDFQTECGGWVDESIAAAFAPSPVRIFVRTPGPPPGEPNVPPPPGAPAPPAPSVPGQVRITAPTPDVPAVARIAPAPPTPALPPFGAFLASGMVPFAGAQFAAMDDDMAEALGATRGVLVLRIGRGTPAERSGLRGGDVVVSVDGRATNSPVELLRALERAESVREVSLRLVRKRKPISIDLNW